MKYAEGVYQRPISSFRGREHDHCLSCDVRRLHHNTKNDKSRWLIGVLLYLGSSWHPDFWRPHRLGGSPVRRWVARPVLAERDTRRSVVAQQRRQRGGQERGRGVASPVERQRGQPLRRAAPRHWQDHLWREREGQGEVVQPGQDYCEYRQFCECWDFTTQLRIIPHTTKNGNKRVRAFRLHIWIEDRTIVLLRKHQLLI